MFSLRNKKGFTLIELLIVITIIGILAVAFLPSLLNAPAKARDTQRTATVQKIMNVITSKSLTSGKFPGVDNTPYCIDAMGTLDPAINATDFGGKLPVDPSGLKVAITGGNNCDYVYVKKPNNSSYSIGVYSRVEDTSKGNVTCQVVAGPPNVGTITVADSATANTTPADCYAALAN